MSNPPPLPFLHQGGVEWHSLYHGVETPGSEVGSRCPAAHLSGGLHERAVMNPNLTPTHDRARQQENGILAPLPSSILYFWGKIEPFPCAWGVERRVYYVINEHALTLHGLLVWHYMFAEGDNDHPFSLAGEHDSYHTRQREVLLNFPHQNTLLMCPCGIRLQSVLCRVLVTRTMPAVCRHFLPYTM